MSNLTATISSLQDLVLRMEANSGQAQQYRSNANLAYTGAVLVNLLTGFSSRRTVRTVGSVVAIGGVLYGSNQSNHAANLDGQNNGLIDAGLGSIEMEGLSRLRSETNPDVIRRFLELVLRLGRQVDDLAKRYGNRLKNKSLLGIGNQQMLLQAANIDIIRNKFRLNRIFSQVDRTKVFPDLNTDFSHQVSAINVAKLEKEGLISKIIIGASVGIGLIFPLVLLLGLGFWGFNHFFPVFPETRKLKNALNALIGGLQNQPIVQTLSFTP